MRGIFFTLALATMVTNAGCALLAAPGLEEAGSLAGVALPGMSGTLNTESTVSVNNSWIKANDLQAQYTQMEAVALAHTQKMEQGERAATEGILKSMAKSDGDPEIADLALWVKAGGDPQYALNSAFARDNDDAARAQVVRMLEGMSERGDDPRLYELALWVRAGGDEKVALEYALHHDAKTESADSHS